VKDSHILNYCLRFPLSSLIPFRNAFDFSFFHSVIICDLSSIGNDASVPYSPPSRENFFGPPLFLGQKQGYVPENQVVSLIDRRYGSMYGVYVAIKAVSPLRAYGQ